jgi:hypothetical protein
MGGSHSTTVYNQMISAVSEALVDSTQDCKVAVQSGQSIIVNGSNNDISRVTMVQGVLISASCLGSSTTDSTLQQQVQDKLDQWAKDQDIAGFSALNNMTTSSTGSLTDAIASSITVKSMQNCATSVNNQQKIDVTGNNNVVYGIQLNIVDKLLRSCVQTSVANSQLGSVLKSISSQVAQTIAKNPLKVLADMLESIPETIIALIGGIIAMVFLGILIMKMRGSHPTVVEASRTAASESYSAEPVIFAT